MSDSLWPVFVGGGIGLAGGIIGPVCLQFINRRADRVSLAGAITSEIAALLEIAEARNYLSQVAALITEVENASGQPSMPAWFYFSVRRNPFMVYHANLSRIGMLRDPMPAKIVRFYAMVSSVLEDIEDMKTLGDKGETVIPRNRESSIRALKNMHALFSNAFVLGKQIVAEAPKQKRWI